MRYRKNEQGFTLIELMATLVILALIIAIAVPAIGKLVTKANDQADQSSIALMERAGEMAELDGLKFDDENPAKPESITEKDVYMIPTLIEAGYLKLDDASKFNKPENYVKKVNKSGKFIYMGKGKDDSNGNEDVVVLGCDEAEALGYTCIYTPEEFDAMRSGLADKYILMNDIDLAQFSVWQPIGSRSAPFLGELRGNGMTVSGLTLGVNNNEDGTNALFGSMAYGKISDVTFRDIQMDDQAISRDTAFLVADITSTDTNNPERLSIEFANIKLTGVATGVSSFGTFASNVETNNALIIHDIETDVLVTGTGYIAGFISDYEGSSATSRLSMKNVAINGTLSTGDYNNSAGVVLYFTIGDSAKATFEGIRVNADITADNLAVGFANNFYVEDSAALEINDVVVSGDVTSAGLNGGATGMFNYVYVEAADVFDVKNIRVTGDLTSNRVIGGFSYYIDFDSNTVAHTIADVSITSKMTGPDVSAFALYVATANNPGKASIRNVSIASVINQTSQFNTFTSVTADSRRHATGGHLFELSDFAIDVVVNQVGVSGDTNKLEPSSLFATDAELMGDHSQLSFKNIAIDANATVEGDVSGFITTMIVTTDTGAADTNRFSFENIDLTGSLMSLTGDTFGWVDYMRHSKGMPTGSYVMTSVDARYALVAKNGTVFAPKPADIPTYLVMYEHTRDGMDVFPTNTSNVTVSGSSFDWDVSKHTGAQQQTR